MAFSSITNRINSNTHNTDTLTRKEKMEEKNQNRVDQAFLMGPPNNATCFMKLQHPKTIYSHVKLKESIRRLNACSALTISRVHCLSLALFISPLSRAHVIIMAVSALDQSFCNVHVDDWLSDTRITGKIGRITD